MNALRARNRLHAFILKEFRQMIRDKSTLTLGIILPGFLLVLFGYGLSLDVTLVPVAVVRDTSAPATQELLTALSLSRYFDPVSVTSMQEAEKLFRAEKVEAIIRRAPKERHGEPAAIQIICNGRDANKARITQRYFESALVLLAAKNSPADIPGMAAPEPRVWYNHAMESSYFLVPGVVMLVMTLIGSLLTALIVAREWERGTFEALLATPITMNEIVLGKIVPYFLLGMAGLSICLATSAFLFNVPIRGSLALLVAGSALYLLVALGIGLLVSTVVKNQFLASQFVLVFCFLPTLMLSGFIFDLQSAPACVYYLAHAFPATWYVDLIQTLFLVGNVPHIIARDFAVLTGFAAAMLALARAASKKTLE